MSKKQELLKAMLSNKQASLPILTFPAVQLLGITVRELISDSSLQAQAMKRLSDNYPLSGVLSMMDLSVEAEAFGSPIKYYDMDIPTVTGPILFTHEDAKKISIPDVMTNRTYKYVEGIREAKALIKDKPVFAGVIGPFSLAGRLIDMTEVMVNCYVDPDFVHETLKKASAFIKEYILAFKNAGADGILMAEPAAGLLSPETCDEFSSRYIREIVREVTDDEFAFIYHNCGNVIPLAQSLLSIDADAYHFGDHIDLEKMLDKLPPSKIVMGNISPTYVFRNGNPESVKNAVFALLDKCSKYPNFIISSGCDIPPLTPFENIEAFFKAVADYYAEKS
jgi:uroporphyrinogen decarboxylase